MILKFICNNKLLGLAKKIIVSSDRSERREICHHSKNYDVDTGTDK